MLISKNKYKLENKEAKEKHKKLFTTSWTPLLSVTL